MLDFSAKRKRNCARPAGDSEANGELTGMTRMTAGADVNKKGTYILIIKVQIFLEGYKKLLPILNVFFLAIGEIMITPIIANCKIAEILIESGTEISAILQLTISRFSPYELMNFIIIITSYSR